MSKIQKDGEITSISHAVDTIRALQEDDFTKRSWPFHKFPFGLWFRGQSKIDMPLDPPVFREVVPEQPCIEESTPIQQVRVAGGIWDETNVYEHLKLRVPNYQRIYRSAFDWLCLMQHYSVPTRLLDWSESILPALYFAVKDDPLISGEFIVLNARRLNGKRKNRPTISSPTNGHVIIQSEMAATRSARTLGQKAIVIESAREEGMRRDKAHKWLNSFRTPIAVFPSRLNDRMIFQASVFTLHGGKKYLKEMRPYYEKEIIPEPISLETINDQCDENERILKRYTISPKAKGEILDDLLILGINEGTLFPEVDHQAVYLKKLWWYKDESDK